MDYQALIRPLRNCAALWGDMGAAKEEQAARLLKCAKARAMGERFAHIPSAQEARAAAMKEEQESAALDRKIAFAASFNARHPAFAAAFR